MESVDRRKLDLIAAAGLAVGGVGGLAGTFVSSAALRQELWLLDGVGIIVACALLVMKFFRAGSDCVAAGFLVFGIGESLLVSGTAAGIAGSVPSFGGGVALWSAGLLLISVPKEFATGVRLIGIVASIPFALTALGIAWGQPWTPLTSPLPFFAYPFVVLTFGGWIWSLVSSSGCDPARP